MINNNTEKFQCQWLNNKVKQDCNRAGDYESLLRQDLGLRRSGPFVIVLVCHIKSRFA